MHFWNVCDLLLWRFCWTIFIPTVEPMLDCSIFPIKHIFNATQKSRYGTTKARKGRRVRPRAAPNIPSKDGAFHTEREAT